MNKKTKEIKGVKIVYEHFERGSEMLGIVRGREQNPQFEPWDTFNENSYAGGYWENYDDVEELWGKLQYGVNDTKLIEATKKLTAQVRTEEKRKLNRIAHDVCGPAVDIGRFIAGDPNCCLTMRHGKTKSKIIDIYVDGRVNGDVDQEEYEFAGKLIASAIARIEQIGYRVRISAMALSAIPECKELVMMSLRIKNEHQAMDMKRLLFPLADVAFFRGVVFGWRARLPEMKDARDIGQSAEGYMSRKNVDLQDIYDLMLGDKCVTLKLSHVIYMRHQKTEDEILSYLESRFLGE